MCNLEEVSCWNHPEPTCAICINAQSFSLSNDHRSFTIYKVNVIVYDICKLLLLACTYICICIYTYIINICIYIYIHTYASSFLIQPSIPGNFHLEAGDVPWLNPERRGSHLGRPVDSVKNSL